MRIDVHNSCKDFNSYRAARVKSLFNAESGAEFNLTAELPIDDQDWKLGIVVGPSGYGGHFRAVQGFKYVGEK